MNLENLNTKFIGKEIIYFEELESTQKYIKQRVNELENGAIVITDNQTNGVGTHDRKWYSTKGENLTFSMVLYPKCKVKKLEGLTKKIAEILVETLKKLYKINITIKEPNDLLIEGKKFCGILTETNLKGETVENLVIGIGMNVNQEELDIDIKEIATSLKLEYNRNFNKEEILKEFLENFEKNYIKIIDN